VIAACEYCGESFECAKTPYRVHKKPAQRFCSAGCRCEFYNEERRQALAAWRHRQLVESFEQPAEPTRRRA
jgi:hypothetical protein